MEEIWKQIEDGYEEYQVSNFGQIKSLKSKNEKILHLDKDRYGYMNVKLCKNGTMKNFKVHRLVAMAFIENPNGFPEINHKDGNKENNFVENLEWVTKSQNIKHAFDTGLKLPNDSGCIQYHKPSYGENNGRHKLTKQDVDDILEAYIPGDPIFGGRALARKYGVGATTIQSILRHKTWVIKKPKE